MKDSELIILSVFGTTVDREEQADLEGSILLKSILESVILMMEQKGLALPRLPKRRWIAGAARQHSI